jgi:hypothetical protein
MWIQTQQGTTKHSNFFQSSNETSIDNGAQDLCDAENQIAMNI